MITVAQVAASDWPAAVVAIGMMALVAALMIVAMHRDGIDAGLKMWAALGTLVGILTGSMATFFFTRQSTQAAIGQAQAAEQLAQHATEEAQSLRTDLARLDRDNQLLLQNLQVKQDALEDVLQRNPAIAIPSEAIKWPPNLLEWRHRPPADPQRGDSP